MNKNSPHKNILLQPNSTKLNAFGTIKEDVEDDEEEFEKICREF